jgi:hypothetical protein
LPALVLDAPAVSAQLEEDAKLAKTAPQTQRAKELWTMYLQFGESEVVTLDQPQLAEQRRRTLRRARELVTQQSGQAAAKALRAQAVEQLEAAFAGQLPAAQVKGLLGVFAHVLVQHQATQDGLELAPHFVIRTLYKARWNRMLGEVAEAELSAIEKRAYFGWMGLHAANLPLREREKALESYAAAGGENAEQAVGVLAFVQRDYARAASSLQRAYNNQGGLRLRNYLRGAQVAAAQPVGAPDLLSSVAEPP